MGRTSDSGFELGKELTFDYALLPHAGDWRKAGVYRDGLEFNLMEDRGRKLTVADGALELDLRPFEIKTIRWELQHMGAPGR